MLVFPIPRFAWWRTLPAIFLLIGCSEAPPAAPAKAVPNFPSVAEAPIKGVIAQTPAAPPVQEEPPEAPSANAPKPRGADAAPLAKIDATPAAKVAVVAPLHFATTDAEDRKLAQSLGEVLAVAIADQKNIVVVERSKLDEVLKEQKLSASGLVDPTTAARLGKLLMADIVVTGSIVDAEGKLRYAVHVVAVDGQRVIGSVEMDGTRKDLDRVMLELSSKVATVAGVKLPAIKPEELDDSPVGRLHLMRGVSFFHANNPDQAIAYCLRAVQLDPRLQEARVWIARAYLAQGQKSHARAELKRLYFNPAAKHLAGQVKQLLGEAGEGSGDAGKAPAKKG